MLQYFSFNNFWRILLASAFVKQSAKFLIFAFSQFCNFQSFRSMAMAKGKIFNIAVT
jgi:hypothetical protein